jgi:hypothetical protein
LTCSGRIKAWSIVLESSRQALSNDCSFKAKYRSFFNVCTQLETGPEKSQAAHPESIAESKCTKKERYPTMSCNGNIHHQQQQQQHCNSNSVIKINGNKHSFARGARSKNNTLLDKQRRT